MARNEFYVSIRTDTPAFCHGKGPREIARILRRIADTIECDTLEEIGQRVKLHDADGYHIGGYRHTGK